MKIRVRNVHIKPTTIGNTQPLLNRLGHLSTSAKPLPKQIPNTFGSNLHTTSLLEERLIAINTERAQAAARAYVNMLPPR